VSVIDGLMVVAARCRLVVGALPAPTPGRSRALSVAALVLALITLAVDGVH
jgi:hypothetical protein